MGKGFFGINMERVELGLVDVSMEDAARLLCRVAITTPSRQCVGG